MIERKMNRTPSRVIDSKMDGIRSYPFSPNSRAMSGPKSSEGTAHGDIRSTLFDPFKCR
jgi:hypothetical protein